MVYDSREGGEGRNAMKWGGGEEGGRERGGAEADMSTQNVKEMLERVVPPHLCKPFYRTRTHNYVHANRSTEPEHTTMFM